MNKNDREHLAKVAAIECCVCVRLGYGESPAEIHHIRAGVGKGQRASHMDAIPLCANHHRNGGYGAAFHAGKKAFEDNFGTELELLEWVREQING